MPRIEVKMLLDVPESSDLLYDPKAEERLRGLISAQLPVRDHAMVREFEMNHVKQRYVIVQEAEMTDTQRIEYEREHKNAKFVPLRPAEYFEQLEVTEVDVAGAIQLAVMGNLNGAIRVLAQELHRNDAAGFELTRSMTFRDPADEE